MVFKPSPGLSAQQGCWCWADSPIDLVRSHVGRTIPTVVQRGRDRAGYHNQGWVPGRRGRPGKAEGAVTEVSRRESHLEQRSPVRQYFGNIGVTESPMNQPVPIWQPLVVARERNDDVG